MPITFKFNKGWSWTMEEVSECPTVLNFANLFFYPCISLAEPQTRSCGEPIKGKSLMIDWHQEVEVKCMSKPKHTGFSNMINNFKYFETWRSCKFVNHCSFWNIKKPKFHSRHCSGKLVLLWHFWGLFPSLHACLVDLVWGWDHESDVEVLGGSSHLLRGKSSCLVSPLSRFVGPLPHGLNGF